MSSLNDKPNIKRNFILSLFYQILNVLTPFITSPFISRVLGAEGVGIQSYTSSVQSFFLMFAALGTSLYGAREISQNRDNRHNYSRLFYEIELLSVFTTFVCIVGWFLLIGFSQEYRAYYLALLPVLFAIMFDISWFFCGLEQFKYIVGVNSFFKILGIVLMFLFVRTSNDILVNIVIFSVTIMLANLSSWLFLPRFLEKVNFHDLHVWRHLKETNVYFIPTIATSIYLRIDKMMIGLITHDASENGYYAQAEKIINLAKNIVFTAINSVVGVRMSYLFAGNKVEEIHNHIKNSMNYILFMGFGCMFGIIGVADNFVPVFFGPGFSNVVFILYAFSPILVIIGVSNCLETHYYVPSGRRKQSTKYIILGTAVNLIMNLLLIPWYGAYGATVASVIAELVISIVYVRMSNGFMSMKMLIQVGWKKLLAGSVMLIVVLYIGHKQLHNQIILLGIQVICGVLTYLMLLLMLKDDWTKRAFKEFLASLNRRWIRKSR